MWYIFCYCFHLLILLVLLDHFNHKIVQFLQDFAAPFYLFINANFSSSFTYADNFYAPQKLIIGSTVEAKFINSTFKKINFELELFDQCIQRFTIYNKNSSEKYTRVV